MKNKKKIALIMIGVVSIAAMAGCGIKKDNGEDTKEEVITATPTLSPMPDYSNCNICTDRNTNGAKRY